MAKHVWSIWGPWEDAGNGQEMRERHCLDATCGETETQWRRKKEEK